VSEVMIDVPILPGHVIAVPRRLVRCPHDGEPVLFTLEQLVNRRAWRLGIECHGVEKTCVIDDATIIYQEGESGARQRLGLYLELIKALPKA